jgi:hypothetical protein
MAVGKVEITIRDLKQAKLLIFELNELERSLVQAGDQHHARKLNHALRRFISSFDDKKDAR